MSPKGPRIAFEQLADPPAACVWELAIVDVERRDSIEDVLAYEDGSDLERYLSRTLAEDVSPAERGIRRTDPRSSRATRGSRARSAPRLRRPLPDAGNGARTAPGNGRGSDRTAEAHRTSDRGAPATPSLCLPPASCTTSPSLTVSPWQDGPGPGDLPEKVAPPCARTSFRWARGRPRRCRSAWAGPLARIRVLGDEEPLMPSVSGPWPWGTVACWLSCVACMLPSSFGAVCKLLLPRRSQVHGATITTDRQVGQPSPSYASASPSSAAATAPTSTGALPGGPPTGSDARGRAWRSGRPLTRPRTRATPPDGRPCQTGRHAAARVATLQTPAG